MKAKTATSHVRRHIVLALATLLVSASNSSSLAVDIEITSPEHGDAVIPAGNPPTVEVTGTYSFAEQDNLDTIQIVVNEISGKGGNITNANPTDADDVSVPASQMVTWSIGVNLPAAPGTDQWYRIRVRLGRAGSNVWTPYEHVDVHVHIPPNP